MVIFLQSVCTAGLKPGTEYGIGVTAVKNERESLPATTNAETGNCRLSHPPLHKYKVCWYKVGDEMKRFFLSCQISILPEILKKWSPQRRPSPWGGRNLGPRSVPTGWCTSPKTDRLRRRRSRPQRLAMLCPTWVLEWATSSLWLQRGVSSRAHLSPVLHQQVGRGQLYHNLILK